MTKTISGHLRTLGLIGLALLSTSALASISVTLSPSPAGPQPVGTIITWTATVSDTTPGTHEYRFTVGPAAGPFSVVRDFNLANTFPWAFSQTEGTYKVRVVVQNTSNQTSAYAAVNFVVTFRRLNGLDAVTPTANPLVALFSGPPCDIHNTIRIRFNLLGSSVSQTLRPHEQRELLHCGHVPELRVPDASRNGFVPGDDRPNWEHPNVQHRLPSDNARIPNQHGSRTSPTAHQHDRADFTSWLFAHNERPHAGDKRD